MELVGTRVEELVDKCIHQLSGRLIFQKKYSASCAVAKSVGKFPVIGRKFHFISYGPKSTLNNYLTRNLQTAPLGNGSRKPREDQDPQSEQENL